MIRSCRADDRFRPDAGEPRVEPNLCALRDVRPLRYRSPAQVKGRDLLNQLKSVNWQRDAIWAAILGSDVDENSEDGQLYAAALDTLKGTSKNGAELGWLIIVCRDYASAWSPWVSFVRACYCRGIGPHG